MLLIHIWKVWWGLFYIHTQLFYQRLYLICQLPECTAVYKGLQAEEDGKGHLNWLLSRIKTFSIMRGAGCQIKSGSQEACYVYVRGAMVQKMLTKLGLDIWLQMGLCLRGAWAEDCITIYLKHKGSVYLTSSVWIPQQNVVQTHYLMPTVSDCNLQINSSPKLANNMLRQNETKQKQMPLAQQLGFSIQQLNI